ncbi:MAG: molecular chaperone HtpG [Christensenellales bacterium]
MAKKQFKTESKRILTLMINSVYTNKEIFLRELISNASDAMDKLYFRSLTDDTVKISRENFKIRLAVDKENRTLTVSDSGCGMNEEELSDNLGVIAQSGTMRFKEENKDKEDLEVIGQFGVGFYSAFMVSSRVVVVSRPFGSEQAWMWESSGVDGYTISPGRKDDYGTDVILYIKEKEGEDSSDEFLQQYRLSQIVKKYSDYIRYPIVMDMEHTRLKEGSKDQYETYIETETLNSMIPIWRKNRADLKDEDYNNFYKDKFYDFEDPLKVIHSRTEGALTYTALLYLPAHTPFNYYSKEYEKGLQLYANGVLIMDKCADLLLDHFSFVKGLVDSQDLSLNISREMLQQNRQVKAMAASIAKKIKAELDKLLKDEREKYEAFYKNFGLQLKYGLYAGYGANKETLQDLVLFYSMKEKKLVTLKEYVDAMSEIQKYIYYVCAQTTAKAELLPQSERVRDAGFDILCMTDDIDEFAVKMLGSYENKEFRSVSGGDLGLEEEVKNDLAAKESENKGMLDFMKEALGDAISRVKLSPRLKQHPVCLTSEGELSIEMEKVLSAMPMEHKAKAEKVLELNASHPVFEKLRSLYETDQEKLKQFSRLLYSQALLIEGLPLDDPVAFSNEICALMTNS